MTTHNTILFCDSHLRREVRHERRGNSVSKWLIENLFRLKTNAFIVKKNNPLILIQISLKNIYNSIYSHLKVIKRTLDL